VIGGGFTAMDCARTALRLNSEVGIYYRRSKEEMAVPADELAEVQHENIPLELMAGPVAYLSESGRGIEAMRFVRNELGAPDDSGRRRPVPVAGSEFDVAVDTVLLATGQWQDTSWLSPDVAKFVLDDDGWIERGRPVHTRNPALFLAGDYSIGASTLIDAIGHAKTCARAVDEYLVGERRMMDVAQIETAYRTGRTHDLDAIPRQVNPTLPLKARSFKAEVETGFDRIRARTESSRCYLCHFKFEIDNDICIYCEKCLEVKPQETCIVRVDELSYDDEGRITGYVNAKDPTPHAYPLLYINQDECIRCGECEKVCPVECISIQKVSRHSERPCDVALRNVS
jgi:formate dehydrogenase major subunit